LFFIDFLLIKRLNDYDSLARRSKKILTKLNMGIYYDVFNGSDSEYISLQYSVISKVSITFFLLVIVFLAVGIVSSKTLVPDGNDARYGINFWREAEGLPQSRIRAITQTRDGYLWLGTDNGAVRFNGANFNAFTVETGSLKDNEVWSLQEDNDGGLWIGTYGGGLTLFRDGRFTTFTQADGLLDDIITQLDKDPEGNIWMGTPSGVTRFSNGVFTNFTIKDGLVNNHINAICAHSPFGVLVAAGSKLFRFQDGKFTSDDALVKEGDGEIEHILSSSNGSLWFSFSSPVIKKWKDGIITAYTRKNNLTPHIDSIYEDEHGTFWAVLENGLNKLQDEKFIPVPLESGSAKIGVIYSLFSDSQGNMWLGLQSNGLGRLRIKEISTISEEDGLSNDSTRAVFEDSQKNLWIGTAGGFSIYRNGAISNYESFEGKRFSSIRSFAEDDNGNIWIAAGKSLLLMKNGKLTQFSGWTSRFDIKVIYRDPKGFIWIGTDGDGLFKYEAGNFINYQTQDGLAGNNVRGILYDRQGAIWISCSGNGISKYLNGKFTNYTTQNGLAGNRVLVLYEDDEGTLWFGTREGLSRFKNEKFFSYTAESGLFVGFIYTILDDSKGNFWFSCAKGLFRVSKAELNEFAEGQRKKVTSVDYGVSDGLKTRAFNLGNQPAAWKTREGSLMFSSLKGLVVVDPNRISSSSFIPPVYIEEIILNREKYSSENQPEIPSGNGEVELHFAALNYLSPEKLRFKYKLEGYDEDWIDAGTRRFAYYTNLPPGQYRFRVTAGNVDGVWNEQGALFSFYLQPHFYQTRWFFLLIIAVVILIAGLLYRLHIFEVKARYSAVLAERNRIALEIHDTLAQNLAGIALHLDSVKMKLVEMPGDLRESINTACNLTRYSLSEARRAVSDLRSDELENQELGAALPEIANRLTADTPIHVNINVTGVSRKLNPVTEKNLLRIFQEALANAVKHSQAGNVEIELKYGINSLILRVADDGKGFNTDNIKLLSIGHYGLIGMRERAERFGGHLVLTSKPGKGTDLNVELSYSTEADSQNNMRLEQ
jgi:signal transduction histidine kinase/ligand-binding sensor domain-containing protein